MKRLRLALEVLVVVLFVLWLLAGMAPFIRALVDLVVGAG